MLHGGSDQATYTRILDSPGRHLFVLEVDVGKRIMAGTLDTAWEAGCYKAMLLTGSRNPATHAFYRACGFSGDAKKAYLARPAIKSTVD